jgi:CRP/FNR family cyclic AMP-dependent transcriptional regulator
VASAKTSSYSSEVIYKENWIGEVPDAVQQAILARMQTIELDRHQCLKEAGETPAAIFQVKAGHLKLMRHLPDGRSRFIVLYSAGSTFGETAVITRRPVYDHTTIALVPSSVRRLTVPDFWELYARHREIAEVLCRKFARLLALQFDRQDLNATSRLRSRIATMLATLAQQLGSTDETGDITFTLPISHTDIAEHVEATRQAVQRELSALSAAGLIARQGDRWSVPNLVLLQATGAAL